MLSCCGPSCPTAPFLKDPCGAEGGGGNLWEQQVVPPGCFPHLQHHQRRAWKCPRSPGRTWRTLPHSSLLPSSLKWDHPARGGAAHCPIHPPHPPSPITQPANKTTPLPRYTDRPKRPPPPHGTKMGTWHDPNPTEWAQMGWGHNSQAPQMQAVVHPLMSLHKPQRAAPQTPPPQLSLPHCNTLLCCITRCPHPAQCWLWAEPRVAAVWDGVGIGHRGAVLGYGMEGDASAHCDGDGKGTQRAVPKAALALHREPVVVEGVGGTNKSRGRTCRGDFLPLFGLIPSAAGCLRAPSPIEDAPGPLRGAQSSCSNAGGAALLPAHSMKWVPAQQKGQQSPQPSPSPRVQSPVSFLCSTTT